MDREKLWSNGLRKTVQQYDKGLISEKLCHAFVDYYATRLGMIEKSKKQTVTVTEKVCYVLLAISGIITVISCIL